MGPLAGAAALAALGLGTGFVGDRFLGDKDYSLGEGAADSIMGLVGGGVGGAVAKRAAMKLLPHSPFIGPLLQGATRGVVQNRFVNPIARAGSGIGGSLPFFNHNDSATGQAGLIQNGFAGIPGLFANVQVEQAQPDPYAGFDAYWRKMRNQYKPVEFQGKSMLEYMDDPDAQRIVDENIAAANKPHREAIRDEKRELKKDLENITILEQEYQRTHRDTQRRQVANSKNIQEGYADATSDIRADADEALNNILAMYNTSDDKTQREIATSAAENRVDASDGARHASEMAQVGSESLAELGAISELESKQDKSDRAAEARQSIRASRRGISDNAAQRRGMIAEVAKSLAADDLQRFGLDIDNAGRRNSFLGQAIQMYPQFGGSAKDPYAESFYSRAGDLAARQMYGVPVEVTQETDQGGQVTMQVPQSVFEQQAQQGYYGGPLKSAYGG